MSEVGNDVAAMCWWQLFDTGKIALPATSGERATTAGALISAAAFCYLLRSKLHMADRTKRNMLVQNRIVHFVAHIRDLVPSVVDAMLQADDHSMQRRVVQIGRLRNVGVGHLNASRP